MQIGIPFPRHMKKAYRPATHATKKQIIMALALPIIHYGYALRVQVLHEARSGAPRIHTVRFSLATFGLSRDLQCRVVSLFKEHRIDD